MFLGQRSVAVPLIPTESEIAKAQRGLHLYHHDLSSCSQRVRMALAELALPFQSHITDLRKNENLSPEYLAINPRGLVPTLVDDGQVVIESIDIIMHLDTRHGAGRLGGSDDPLLAAADRSQSALKVLSHEYMFRARGAPDPQSMPAHPDPETAHFARSFFEDGDDWHGRVRDACRAMAAYLAEVDARLAGGLWLGGARLALADIAWMSTVHRLIAWLAVKQSGRELVYQNQRAACLCGRSACVSAAGYG
jgi:glutathione S-transferase